MSRNGTGTYNLPAGNPVSTGTTISSSWANTTLTDIANALTGSIAKDGQTTATANLPMGTYAHTGVGNATVRTMYASAGQVQDSTLTYLTSVVGEDAITASAPAVMTSYVIGQTFRFIAVGNCTGAVTININSIGVKSIVQTNGSLLNSDDITSGAAVQIMYDGTNFQLISNIVSANSNVKLGYQSLNSNTTGTYNVALGYQPLKNNTTGVRNVAIGVQCLNQNTSGNDNIALGRIALFNNTTGSDNISLGRSCLIGNTSGTYNIALGYAALLSNTIGTNNIALGQQALNGNTTGISNVALGFGAMSSSSTGSNNVALGEGALNYNRAGVNNTAVGAAALYALSKGTDPLIITGDYNSAFGSSALFNNAGNYNTGLGYEALKNNTTGSGNIAINPYSAAGTYAPVFDPTTQNNRLCLGSTAVTNAYVQVAWTVVSDARDKTDFASVPHGLDFVAKLKPTAYRYKMNREDIEGHGVVRYGFKAQDILALEGNTPVIVDAEDSEKLKLNDQSMIAVLVNAIQELNVKFEEYKASHP
jgi:hypothetical protein